MTVPANGPSPSIVARGAGDTLAPPSASQLLHAVTLRPPVLCWDGQAYAGAALTGLDTDAAASVPGVVQVVVRQNFVGVIASQLGQARQARSRLGPSWATPVAAQQACASLSGGASTSANKSESTAATPVTHSGEAESQAMPFEQTYHWQSMSMAGGASAIACFTGQELRVWTRTQHPHALREDLARLSALPIDSVQLFPGDQFQGEGYDAAADATLMSMACGQPVRVQDEARQYADEPIRLTLSTVITPASAPSASAAPATGDSTTPPSASAAPWPQAQALQLGPVTIATHRIQARRPSVAALLSGVQGCGRPLAVARVPQYLPVARLLPSTVPVPMGAAPDGIGAAAQVFAQESFFDEICVQQGVDPVRARRAGMTDPTGVALVDAVAQRAQWFDHTSDANGHSGIGQGFAYAHVIDENHQPARETWSAWVAQVHIDQQAGTVALVNLTVGHHASALETTSGLDAASLETEVRAAAARCLPNEVSFDSWGQEKADQPKANTNSYPVDIPAAQVQLVNQGGALGLGWSPHAELPAAAAIANAINNATGIRLRQLPFDAETLKKRLTSTTRVPGKKKAAWAALGGIAAVVAGGLLSAWPWPRAIAPVAAVDTSIYSAAAIERGRLVAAGGDCMVCHTAKDGAQNAGGLPLDTPFGTVYTTNITPDKATGIGTWSFAAFDRAMRKGIHRDGSHLYPAFPYTSFAKMSVPDMQALYAYLMTQKPVSNQVPTTQLAFPYNVRPLMAGWNLLFHNDQPYKPDPDQSTLWNRGAYLVQGMGHCAACHSPRNALGAEKTGAQNFLAGGFADGWEAPALNAMSKAPIAWNEEELYQYLRAGYSPLHGAAAGPMAPVVESMAALPNSDIRAMAHYLSTLAPQGSNTEKPAMQAAMLEDRSSGNARVMALAGEGLFQGACAVCHDARSGPPLFGARPSLALSTGLHSDHPDNVVQILLHGISQPAAPGLGYMPGFGASMSDAQLKELLVYLRQRFAPDRPAWQGLEKVIQSARNAGANP